MNRPANLWMGPGVLDALVERSGSSTAKPHHALSKALYGAEARDFTLQRGWALCPCEPILVDLPDTSEFSVDAALIGKHASLPPTFGNGFWPEPGQLVGAVVLSSRYTRLMVRGKMLPDYTHVRTWQELAVTFTSRDTLIFSAVKPGGVAMWPCVLVEPMRLPTDEEAGTYDSPSSK